MGGKRGDVRAAGMAAGEARKLEEALVATGSVE